MPENVKIEDLAESFKIYVNTNYKLIKLEAIERTSVIGSGLLSGLIIGLVGLLFVFFLSFGVCFYLSDYFGNYYIGFAIVAGFYLLLCLILIIGQKTFLKRPIRNKIIRKIFSKN